MFFFSAELSLIETEIFFYVLEEMNVYNKSRFLIARLGIYKRIEICLSVER